MHANVVIIFIKPFPAFNVGPFYCINEPGIQHAHKSIDNFNFTEKLSFLSSELP